jgi:hypothetical protein
MSQFTPTVDTALRADAPLIAGLLKIMLPSATVLLTDGSGEIPWNGETYLGRDPVYGVLAAVDQLSDGSGDEAPAIKFTLHPASDAAAADLAGATMQGSPVYLWLATINKATGAPYADPLLLFSGALDQPVLTLDRGTRELEYACVSSMERLFENQEGVRLADHFHQMVWPGETGLANVTSIIKTVYWGVHAPASAIAVAPNSFAGALAGGMNFSFPVNGAAA